MTLIRLTWDTVSAASGVLQGYQIYGRSAGNETYLAKVDSGTTTWDDFGTVTASSLTEPPTANTTDGPVAKYLTNHKDKMILAGFSNEPSRVMWSGGGANVDKFHWSYGGGYVDISKDDGDQIRGVISFQDKIVVWKERSIWQVSLDFNSSFGLVVPALTLITSAHGAISHRTIPASRE
jgi:hypothetical protein